MGHIRHIFSIIKRKYSKLRYIQSLNRILSCLKIPYALVSFNIVISERTLIRCGGPQYPAPRLT